MIVLRRIPEYTFDPGIPPTPPSPGRWVIRDVAQLGDQPKQPPKKPCSPFLGSGGLPICSRVPKDEYAPRSPTPIVDTSKGPTPLVGGGTPTSLVGDLSEAGANPFVDTSGNSTPLWAGSSEPAPLWNSGGNPSPLWNSDGDPGPLVE